MMMQERYALAKRLEAESAKVQRLAAELQLLSNVRRQQDEEAADLLMQFSTSTRQLSLVQKDLVLLRQAWEEVQDSCPALSRTSTQSAEVERLLEKLQSDVCQWQVGRQLILINISTLVHMLAMTLVNIGIIETAE
jgi:hypothetical protein